MRQDLERWTPPLVEGSMVFLYMAGSWITLVLFQLISCVDCSSQHADWGIMGVEIHTFV